MRRRGGRGRGVSPVRNQKKSEEGVDDVVAGDHNTPTDRTKREGGKPRKNKVDCATCLTYTFLIFFFVFGVLIAAAGRPPPPPSRGDPNAPWNPEDDARRGSARGGRGSDGGDTPTSSSFDPHDDDDDERDDEDRDGFRDYMHEDIGLWEGIGIIVVDRLSKVKDYLEGVVETLEGWQAKLEKFNQDLDAQLNNRRESLAFPFGGVGSNDKRVGDGGGGGEGGRPLSSGRGRG